MATAPVTWLGEDFLAAVGSLLLGADLAAPGVTGTVAVVVPAQAGRPRRGGRRSGGDPGPSVAVDASRGGSTGPGEARGTVELRAGRVVGWQPGAVADDAVATITVPEADARAALEGRIEPSVLFMQGRLKTDGDMAAVLPVLAATTSEGYGRARATLAGRLASGG